MLLPKTMRNVRKPVRISARNAFSKGLQGKAEDAMIARARSDGLGDE
jgi:hypothetical protein